MALDRNRALIDQGPFDVILHKVDFLRGSHRNLVSHLPCALLFYLCRMLVFFHVFFCLESFLLLSSFSFSTMSKTFF